MARRDDLGGGRGTAAPNPSQPNNANPGGTNLNAGSSNFAGQGAQGGQAGGLQGQPFGNQQTDQGGSQRQGQQAQGTTQQVKHEAKNLVSEARQETVHVAEQARDHVEHLLSRQKDQAAERLGGCAGALREAANKLNEGDNSSFGRYADQAAQQVERLSNYLRQGDLRAFVNDTEGFARRHPDLFLGSTFVAGLFLARFLKSSNPRRKALVPYERSQSTSYGRRLYTTERYPGAGSFSDTRPYNPAPAGV